MGADLFKSDAVFRGWVALASELVGEDLEPLCLRGPEKKLVRTRLLQPLLVAIALGYHRQLNERGVKPDLVAGHSLGEIAALAAAGVIAPETAVRLAAKRGELMDEAAARVEGGMLAVTLEDRSGLMAWLAAHQPANEVVLANDNAPTQVVLSGHRAVLAACAEFITNGKLGRSRLLPVSGPWHSPFMAEAAAHFGAWLGRVPMQAPRLPILFNVSGAPAESPEEIRAHLGQALARPVRWTACMAAIRAREPQLLFEVGPGGVLAALARANGFGEAIHILRVNNLRGVELAAKTVTGADS